MAKYFDTHTLYTKCDCASVEQIRTAFNEALTKYQKENGVNLNCRYRINLLTDREGNSFGTAFIFVTNSEVYHMLLGKNPDGSDRIEYMDDPSWEPPKDNEMVNESGWTSVTDSLDYSNMSWADICDEEEEFERQKEEEEKRFVCPQIAIELEPLMTLPPYKLTPQQIEDKKYKIIQENEGKEDFDPSLVTIPEYAYFGVDRAMVIPVDPKFMPNILKTQNVPDWITKEDLKAQFTPYASDSRTIQERTIKGRRVEETYPFVNINEGRVAFIIFDPSTHDAQFALHMMKKTQITKKLPNGVVNNVTLIFGHSYCTDRDSMSTITQKPRPVQPRNSHNNKSTVRFSEPPHHRKNNNNRSTEISSSKDKSIKHAVANATPQRKTPTIKSKNLFDLLNDN